MFFEVFGRVWTCLYLFGSVRIRSDAFGCVWARSDAFGRVQKKLIFFGTSVLIFCLFASFEKIFGPTDLKIRVSGARFEAEKYFEVHFAPAPQKHHKNCEKLNISVEIIFNFSKNSKIFRKRPNASERAQTHPNASERIRTGPNRSKQIQKPLKKIENFGNLSKTNRASLAYET